MATACYGKDVHWFDSCGAVLELQEDCGSGFCSRGKCVVPNWFEKCRFPPEGRCDGERLQLCDRGDDLQLDCAEQGKECRQGAEGAGCFAPKPAPRCVFGPSRCEGDVLIECVSGYREETPCSWRGAQCVPLSSGGAACATAAPQDIDMECGACGCKPLPNGAAELCDGRDDDQNGFVDDGAPCEPVPVDVWVGAGPSGEPMAEEEQLLAEIQRVNDSFRRSESQIQFELGRVSDLSDLNGPMNVEVTFDELLPLLERPNPHRVGSELRARLIVVARLLEGETPRLGVAFPFVTHGCGRILQPGGRRFDRALVAMSVARTPTTLAHELGHWLGLCHTHDVDSRAGGEAVVDPVQGPMLCGEECTVGGDAICDTPPDSDICKYEPTTCLVTCPNGEQPDPSNIMSYYHACREYFSAEQVRVMEHTLALRRHWARCSDGACSCQPGAADCPIGMSCRPLPEAGVGFGCGMDGERRPGQACRGLGDCSDRSLCLSSEQASLCTRPCIRSLQGCTCTPLPDNGLSVCREDLAALLPPGQAE